MYKYAFCVCVCVRACVRACARARPCMCACMYYVYISFAYLCELMFAEDESVCIFEQKQLFYSRFVNTCWRKANKYVV